jgi:hypothetical protein
VRNGVLNNERLDSVRMNKDHAKTYGSAVILRVKRVAREPKSFRKVIHDFGDVIERVRELFRVRPVAVSEAGIIRRDKVSCDKQSSVSGGVPFPAHGLATEILRASEKPPAPYEKPSRIAAQSKKGA